MSNQAALFAGVTPPELKREPEVNGVPIISLRDYQTNLMVAVREAMAAGHKRVVMQAPTGAGKCLQIGTPVLMADGTVKPVEEVLDGEQVMGPDGKPRNVSGVARGHGKLYRVTPVKGDPYVVNDAHILSLKMTPGGTSGRLADGTRFRPSDDIVNVNVEVMMNSTKHAKHQLKGWRAGLIKSFGRDDEHKPVPAYIVGAYLGDGGRMSGNAFIASISKPECRMVDEWIAYVESRGLWVRRDQHESNSCPRWVASGGHTGGKPNPVAEELKLLGLHLHRAIPDAYKYGDAETRKEVLAGLIDTDGHVTKGCIDFLAKDKRLADDVAFVARSLGLAAYVAQSIKGIASRNFQGEYWRVTISGDLHELPMRDKTVAPRRQKKRHLVHGIKIEPAGEGEWAGFAVDGDHLFLLGDFTVTHNTILAAAVAASAIKKGNTVLFNVYGRTLVSQGAREFRRLNLPVGVIMAGQPYKKNLPLQVSSVDTIASRVDDMDWFKPDLIITDEAHESLSDKFQLVRELWPDAFELQITATPMPTSGRGMKEVASALVPGPSYQQLIDGGFLVRPRFITTDESEAKLLKVNYASGEFSNKSNEAAFNDAVVLGRIVERWVGHGEGRPTVLYAASVAHSMELTEQFNKAGYSWAHVDANTPDEERQEYYAQLATGELRGISNFGILGRGWDCPPVSCVILARAIRHITNYIQIIGRAMRASPGKVDCLVLDMAENYWRGHGDFVLDPVEWSLDGSSISDLMKQRKEVLEAEAYHCPACHAVIRGKSCTNCGFVVPPKPPKPNGTAEGDGTLKEVTGSPNRRAKTDGVARKRQVYEQLLGLGVERGWQKWKGRAYYLYKEYYGVFPAGVVQKGAGVVSPGWEIRRWYMEYEQRRRAARAAKKHENERRWWS